MKSLRQLAPLLSLPLCLLSVRGDEAPPSAGSVVAGVVDPIVEEIAEAVAPAMTAEERAAKLGFAAHLSPDSDLFMALYDGSGMVRGLADLDVWEFIRKVVKEEEGVDPEEQIAGVTSQVESVLGTELFLAFGPGSADQYGVLNELSVATTYYQFRAMARSMARGAAEGDLEQGVEDLDNPEWLGEFARDIGRFMPVIEKAQFPPVIAGLRITDEEQMGVFEQQLRDVLGMFGEAGEAVDFEKGGAKFAGSLFKGGMLADAAADDREEMDAMIGEENVDRILASLRQKQLVVCVGRLDDYLLLYFGSSEEACPLVDDLGGSLAADDRISFIDGFKDSPVHGVVYGSEGMMQEMIISSLKQMAEGCRDGIQGVDGLGETRELVALLDMVGEREQALLDLYKAETLGAVISVDQGVRFDLFGGTVSGAVDYESPHRLASLGEGENVLLFANWTNDREYNERASELIELLVEVGYAAVGKIAALEVEDDSLAEFKAGFQMFDGMFREDVVKLWNGLSALDSGLGNEAALIADVGAGFPPVPGVPEGVVKDGRFPRMAVVAPVEERARLKESWTMVDESLRSMLGKVNEMGDMKLHMPSPTNSQADDIVTWYFDALAFSDDLKPSVTVSDEWFVASTSKPQALELMKTAGTGDVVRRGLWMKLDLAVLRGYAGDLLKLADENRDEIFSSESDLASFREALPKIMEGLESLEEFEAVTIHERREAGRRQATLHFHLR